MRVALALNVIFPLKRCCHLYAAPLCWCAVYQGTFLNLYSTDSILSMFGTLFFHNYFSFSFNQSFFLIRRKFQRLLGIELLFSRITFSFFFFSFAPVEKSYECQRLRLALSFDQFWTIYVSYWYTMSELLNIKWNKRIGMSVFCVCTHMTKA